MSVFKINETGAGPINTTLEVPAGRTYQLLTASIKYHAAPTTSESLTFTLDANAGPDYDVLLYTVDPSITAVTDIFWQPDGPLYLEGGDKVDIVFANSDARTYGLQITAGEV